MTNNKILQTIGVIEILIGSFALLGNFILIALSLNAKTPNVLLFVIITATISTLIGIGILRLNKKAREWLIYFSTIILMSKILLLLHIIELNGQLEVTVHKILDIPLTEEFKNFMNGLKNITSMGYHGLLIYFLKQKRIKKLFVH